MTRSEVFQLGYFQLASQESTARTALTTARAEMTRNVMKRTEVVCAHQDSTELPAAKVRTNKPMWRAPRTRVSWNSWRVIFRVGTPVYPIPRIFAQFWILSLSNSTLKETLGGTVLRAIPSCPKHTSYWFDNFSRTDRECLKSWKVLRPH